MRVQVLCTPALLDGSSPRIASLDKNSIRKQPLAVSAGILFDYDRDREVCI